jgi:hypothetical protein
LQDESISATSAIQSLATRSSAASILLDKFLSSQKSPRQQSFSLRGGPATQNHSSIPQQTQNATSEWEHVHFTSNQGNALDSSYFGQRQQVSD